jgi:hypothetical protein
MKLDELYSRLDELASDAGSAGISAQQINAALVWKVINLENNPSILPLSIKDLCRKLDRGRSYVWAMRKAGYKFTHGKRTTLASALLWLKENPYFCSNHYR